MRVIILHCAAWLLILACAPAMGDELDELKQRFQARYPALEQLKHAGVIGETDGGLVEAVRAVDAAASRLIREENSDRLRLYAILAQQQGVPSAVVAQRNAMRNFERAGPGEYLKKGNAWTRK